MTEAMTHINNPDNQITRQEDEMVDSEDQVEPITYESSVLIGKTFDEAINFIKDNDVYHNGDKITSVILSSSFSGMPSKNVITATIEDGKIESVNMQIISNATINKFYC
jgi:hypothetical protein